MSEVEKFLERIGLKIYWPTFKQNAITTLDRLFLITHDLAKELSQPVVDRIVFLENISAKNKILDGTKKIELGEVSGDLIPAIQRRQVALKLNKRVQPFVAVVGASIEKFDMCYVVIDNIKYRFDSIVKVFDICFKIIHSINVEYSYEAKGAWLFVQQALYEISTCYDKKNSGVAALVKSFQA